MFRCVGPARRFTEQGLCAPLDGGSSPATCGGVLESSARRLSTVGHSPQREGRPVSRSAGPPRVGGRLSLSAAPCPSDNVFTGRGGKRLPPGPRPGGPQRGSRRRDCRRLLRERASKGQPLVAARRERRWQTSVQSLPFWFSRRTERSTQFAASTVP